MIRRSRLKLSRSTPARSTPGWYLKKVPDATTYQLVYGDGQRSEPTIDDFIEVDSLKKFTQYSFQVIAINNAGESQPSKAVEASTDEEELPPVIWATIPTDHSFFIGYSVGLDYMYEVRYGTSPGKYSDTLGLKNVGVCQIPDLQSGQTYYYQMRNRTQWGFASEWTQEIAVTLDDDQKEQDVPVRGVIRDQETALLYFDPVKKAVGYQIFYRKDAAEDWQKLMIDQGSVAFARVDKLENNTEYQFKMKAILDHQAFLVKSSTEARF